MHRPTSLGTLLPSYLPHEELSLALSALAAHRILTDVDLVFAPESLPPDPNLSPRLYSRLKACASSHLSAPSTSGVTLFHRSATARSGREVQDHIVSTSLPTLDSILSNETGPGGFASAALVEVVGTAASGRTAFALYVLLLYLLDRPQRRAAYIDSTGTFDPYRCLDILKKALVPRLRDRGTRFQSRDTAASAQDEANREPTDEQVAMDVLDRISVSRLTKSGQALDKIVDEQERDVGDTSVKLGMVVIDQVDHLAGGDSISSTKSAQGHANLIAFARRLTSLAQSASTPLTILMLNTLEPAPAPTSTATKSPAAQLVSANPQPPPISSLPLLSAFAPYGLTNALSPTSSESWPNLISTSLVLIKSDQVFSTRGTPQGTGMKSGKNREMVSLIEVGKNSRGIGGTGQIVGFKLEDGIRMSEI
ncbi:uncharacterized protein JCM15063_000170 [Sporobolomyces koalae]|uniref:uncharacterized protein n=1 Tax=Sporobolomyces koalae TaxID=500713 RepID=UPI0031767C13